MVKPVFRNKSVTTKVTAAEYTRLAQQAEAKELNLSEWIRNKLLDEGTDHAALVMLAELLALRTVLLNLLFSLSRGEAMTPEQMQAIIERADKDKARRALEKMGAAQFVISSKAGPAGEAER